MEWGKNKYWKTTNWFTESSKYHNYLCVKRAIFPNLSTPKANGTFDIPKKLAQSTGAVESTVCFSA